MTDMTGPQAPEAPVPLLGRPAWWALFAALALAVPAVGLWMQRPPLPVLGELPAFRLVDQKSRPFAKGDLAGHVWAANFVFTRCSSACPMLTARMKRIQDRLDQDPALASVRLLSFSVDPERDQPADLDAYAANFGAKDQTWWFLTGALEEVERTVVSGCKVAMGKVPLAPGQRLAPGEAFDILHGEKFVLLDGAGRIRGYYQADDAGMSALVDGLRKLAREKPRS